MHTPGPWTIVGNDIEGDGMTVVTITEHQRMTPRQQDNARLIAAAPDLLEALRSLVDAYQRHFDVMPVAWQTYDNIAQAAIAKALGE